MLTSLKTSIRMELARRGYDIRGPKSFGVNPLYDLNQFISPRDVSCVFDVGANEGQSLLKFKDYYSAAHVHCFEPASVPFSSLTAMARKYSEVTLNKIALSDRPGSSTLHTHTHHLANSLLSVADNIQEFVHGEKIDNSGEESVEVTTLDQYCSDRSIKTIDLLKIDTQGLELKVLEGGKGMFADGRIRAVMVEFQMSPQYVGQSWYYEICQFLTENNLGMIWMYESVWDDSHFLSWANGLFVLRNKR